LSTDIPPISRALALHNWPEAFRLMDQLVGHVVAGRWLVEELELAGAIAPKEARDIRALEGHGWHGPQPHS
jgi:hypothetical protein